METKIVNLVKMAGWMHEIFHWIPAKLLATNVKACADHVDYDLQEAQWKNVVITSGPLLAGLVFLGIVGRNVAKKRMDKGWIEVALFDLGSSFWDVVDLVYFARNRKWRSDAKRRS